MNENIQKTVKILQQGGIVLLPTDTVFGICCRIDNEETLKRLFTIKKRDEHQAVPILVSSIDMVKKYALPFDGKIKKLMDVYWPGGLTIILSCDTGKVLSLVRGNGKTVGFRIPDLAITSQVIDQLGVPIVGTSANFHGNPSVTKWQDLDPELIKLVDFVVEEDSLGGVASTVVDCLVTPWKILRQGTVIIPDMNLEGSEKKRTKFPIRQLMTSMNTLYIDTTSNKEIIVRLTIADKAFEEKIKIENNRTQVVLPTVQKLLQKNKLSPRDIQKVTVNPMPGSFTGVRVGAAIANAIIFALGLPQDIIEPKYV